MSNFHATCVIVNNTGILLTGASGSGKSDLALRLMSEADAVLVADDQVLLRSADNNRLIAACPPSIAGLLEVRGIGIIRRPYRPETEIRAVFELVRDPALIERLPEPRHILINDISLPLIRLFPFEHSAVHKIVLACDEIR